MVDARPDGERRCPVLDEDRHFPSPQDFAALGERRVAFLDLNREKKRGIFLQVRGQEQERRTHSPAQANGPVLGLVCGTLPRRPALGKWPLSFAGTPAPRFYFFLFGKPRVYSLGLGAWCVSLSRRGRAGICRPTVPNPWRGRSNIFFFPRESKLNPRRAQSVCGRPGTVQRPVWCQVGNAH